jgi:hypothetical protein
VNLEDDVGASFDEFGLARAQNFGGLPGRVSHEEVAGEGAGVRLLFRFHLRSGEENAGLLVAEPV